MVGCVVGSVFGGVGSDTLGRRGCCVAAGAVLLTGTCATMLPLCAEISFLPLFVGRLLVGTAAGLATCAIPAYVSEIARPEQRGGASASFQLSVTSGISAASLFNFNILTRSPQGWMWSFAMQAPLALVFFLTMVFLPESPRWLLLQSGGLERCEVALRRLRVGQSEELVKEEIFELQRCVDNCANGHATGCKDWLDWKVVIALVLLVVQVGAGIDMFTAYNPFIFDALDGEQQQTSLLCTIFAGLIMVVFTAFTVAVVDRVGRRPLLLVGSAGMTLSLTLLALPLNFGTTENILCVMGYIASFSLSLGPIAWVIPAELVNSRIRAQVLSLGAVLNWVTDYGVVSTYLSLTAYAGIKGAFGVYALINLVVFAFLMLCIPETAGIMLDTPHNQKKLVTMKSDAFGGDNNMLQP